MAEMNAEQIAHELRDEATGPPESDIIETRSEYLDFSKLPQSKGIPTLMPVLAVIALIGVMIVAGSVISVAGYGHYWPAEKTLRVPLSGK
jgi:hypothetical protein